MSLRMEEEWGHEEYIFREDNVSLKRWGHGEDVPWGKGGLRESMGLGKICGPGRKRSLRKKNVSQRKWGRGKDVFGGKGGPGERMGLGKRCGLGRRQFFEENMCPQKDEVREKMFLNKRWAHGKGGAKERCGPRKTFLKEKVGSERKWC